MEIITCEVKSYAPMSHLSEHVSILDSSYDGSPETKWQLAQTQTHTGSELSHSYIICRSKLLDDELS